MVYEDGDLAVVNKPAGMMVHAGSGQNEDARSSGTLVNALLYRFNALSSTGGELRPGIVHRLDKDTSGLIVVAKNDRAHAALGEMFCQPADEEDLHCFGAGGDGAGQGNHQCRRGARSAAADADDREAAGQCALGGYSL